MRKAAHFSEYAALGASALFFVRSLLEVVAVRCNPRTAAVSAWLFCALFAAADEFHQLFVPGRSGNPVDVAIDAAGALAGIWIACSLIPRKV